jgi:hypothetical protein
MRPNQSRSRLGSLEHTITRPNWTFKHQSEATDLPSRAISEESCLGGNQGSSNEAVASRGARGVHMVVDTTTSQAEISQGHSDDIGLDLD